MSVSTIFILIHVDTKICGKRQYAACCVYIMVAVLLVEETGVPGENHQPSH
jgi:hypothetical protein